MRIPGRPRRKENKGIGLGQSIPVDRKGRRTILFLALTLMLLLACNSGNRLITDSGIFPVVNDINSDDALLLAGGQPRTLDPALTHGGPDGPVGAIFSGLVSLDPTLQVQPDLAAGWQVSEDGLVYTFYLRQEATFHDGRPLTAEDVIFSWERALKAGTGSDTALTYLGDIVGAAEMHDGRTSRVSGLKAIDDHTLEVRIDLPKVYFLSKLTYPVAFVVDKHNVDQPDWQYTPNGTGPFQLQEWSDDETLVLARNEGYYQELPALKQVVYLIGSGIPLSMYEKGEIDLVWIGGSTLERVQDPNNPLSADLRIGSDMCTTYIGFNNRDTPFNDPLVRQAFSYALDQDKIIAGLYKGNALPAHGLLPPGIPGYSGEVAGYDFDPQKARELMVEAGYANPDEFPPVSFTTSGYGSVGSLETAVITMWQENLGVTVEPLLVEPYNYLDELYAGNTGNIFALGWCADYPDPENFLDLLFHTGSSQNLSGYHNGAVDALLEKARTESDVSRRLTLYQEIERMIVADAPVLFVAHSLSALLVKPELQGYVLTPIGVAQWHLVSMEK